MTDAALGDDPTTILVLSAIKAVTVILGLVVIGLGWRAYRASGRRPFLWLTVGLGLMTIGAIAEGAAYQGLNLSLDQAHVVEALFTLAAFAVLVYSLFAPDRRAARPAPDAERPVEPSIDDEPA